MLNIFYKIIAVILLALMSMILPINIGLTRDFTKGTVEINHPIISKPFKGAKSAAGYFSIKNHGAVKIIFKGSGSLALFFGYLLIISNIFRMIEMKFMVAFYF